METRFSVIIPLYNKEKYIAQTLHSVLNQTFKNFEVLLVDDGSTDSSLAVVKTFRDERLKVYSKKNGGVSDARNFGIDRAKSDYIAFLDADDHWDCTFLEELGRLINKYPGCGIYTSAYRKVKPNKTVLQGEKLAEGIIEEYFKVKLQQLIPWTSAVVAPKKVLQEVKGFPVGMIGGEDEYTWAKIAVKYKVAFTPKVLAQCNEVWSALSGRLGRVDNCKESWFDFYRQGDFYRNEYVARKAIHAGIRYAYSPDQSKSREIEKLTRYTVLSKRLWWDLYLLNRIPYNNLIVQRLISPGYKAFKHLVSGLRVKAASLLLLLR